LRHTTPGVDRGAGVLKLHDLAVQLPHLEREQHREDGDECDGDPHRATLRARLAQRSMSAQYRRFVNVEYTYLPSVSLRPQREQASLEVVRVAVIA
jgi:hypothetical protein